MSATVERPAQPSGRADAVAGALWTAFGLAVATGAWHMDRLERLNINPYEAPGLVPGVLGVVIALLGVVLALRGLGSVGRGASEGATEAAAPGASVWARMALVLGLTLAYALVLVGRGLPFWLATFVFVTVFIGLLDGDRQRQLGRCAGTLWLHASAYGIGWSAVVSLSFEHIFLVRLP